MAPKAAKAKAAAAKPKASGLMKRPSASQLIIERPREDGPESSRVFEKRCSEYRFSELELNTTHAYCSICGRLQSIRDLDFNVLQPNMIEKICLRCYG